jgi:hypothetical protein
MGEISLDMIWKRLEEMQADLKATRTDIAGVRTDLAAVNEKMGGMATTLVGVQRDVRSLQGTVATLGVAVDDHTHRLERIEQRLGIGVTPN